MTTNEAASAACSLISRARGKDSVVVAIDGGGGAGKSTLAASIRDAMMTVSIVRVDDFYRPLHNDPRAETDPGYAYLYHLDCGRIRDEALVPLRAGRRVRYQPIEWVSGEPLGWVEVERNPILVLEGVYSMRPELRDLIDVAVFVDTPRDLRRKRMSDRLQAGSGWIDRWMAAEDWYLENLKPAESADLIVKGF